MIIIPGEYTFRLDSVISEADPTVILTGETDFTVESGMENVTICFMLSSPAGATGNGSVSLYLSADTDTNIKTFSVSAGGTGDTTSFSWSEDEEETSYLKGTLSCTSLAPGTYTLVITGLNSSGEPVYVRHEVLTVWSNVVSGRWLFADGTETDELKITTSDLYSTFYVKGEEGPYSFYTDTAFGDAEASDTNSGSMNSPLSTISAAITKCTIPNKQYTIYIDGTFTAPDDTSGSFIDITPSIPLNLLISSLGSETAVINAKKKARVINVTGTEEKRVTLTLKNVQIMGGNLGTAQGSECGGGIKAEYADITLESGTVIGKKMTDGSASDRASDSDYSNQAYRGAGIYISNTNLTIKDDVYICHNNTFSASDTGYPFNYGGGIYAETNSTIIMNGGTIGWNNGHLGGAIWINGGALKITGGKICYNYSNYRYQKGHGGAIFLQASDTSSLNDYTISNCEISYNETSDSTYGRGGAIVLWGNETLTLNNVNFHHNKSAADGGVLYANTDVTITATDCIFENNTASLNGGVFYNSGTTDGSLTLENCTFSGNTSTEGGGCLYISSISSTVTNCEFTQNTTEQSGGAIKNSGTLNITDCSFSENKANFGGGIDVDSGTVTITGTGDDTCVFQSNEANGGGAMSVSSGTVQAEKVKFDSNSSTSTGAIGGGGGFWIARSSVTLTNCNLSNNTAANLGGAAWVVYDSSISWVDATASSSLTMNGCTVSSNTAINGGGGICIDDDNGTVEIKACTISENNKSLESISGDGGGIYVKATKSFSVEGGTISSNAARSGGGVECIKRDNEQITVNFTDCKITGNKASNNGGGVSIDSNVNATFTSCEITGNTATSGSGGGLYLWNSTHSPAVTLTDCTIKTNKADNNRGGAIRTDGGDLTLTLTGTQTGGGTKISDNTSSDIDAGKSIYLTSGRMEISGYIQIDSNNDVRLRTYDPTDDIIRTTITSTLKGTSPVITITPDYYTVGKQIVSAGTGVDLATEVKKIAVTKDSSGNAWKVDEYGKLAKQ